MSLEQDYQPYNIHSEPPSSVSLVGWALVAGSLATFSYIIFPPRLMEPQWEFQTMMAFVDNSLLPLLGIALALYGRPLVINWLKLLGMRFLLVFTLALALLYIGFLPLAVHDMQRLQDKMNHQIVAAEAIQSDHIRKLDHALSKAVTMPELQILCVFLTLTPALEQRRTANPKEPFEATRTWLQTRIHSDEHEGTRFAREAFKRDHSRLIKDTVKIGCGATLAAICYIVLLISHRDLLRKHVPSPDSPETA